MKTLFLVPRARVDLLPFYARMTTTLDKVWNDIGPSLVKDLEQQFHGQAKFKKNQNLEARMRTARYIGELTKFKAAPPIVALRCLHRCVEDFTGNNVDVACCMLESCGRYLYRMAHTNPRLTSLMETMTRLSKAKVSSLCRSSRSPNSIADGAAPRRATAIAFESSLLQCEATSQRTKEKGQTIPSSRSISSLPFVGQVGAF